VDVDNSIVRIAWCEHLGKRAAGLEVPDPLDDRAHPAWITQDVMLTGQYDLDPGFCQLCGGRADRRKKRHPVSGTLQSNGIG
jgi:hypothetical protein